MVERLWTVAQHLPQGRHQAGDRHLKIHESRDNLTHDVSYSYDNDGHRTQMVDGSGTSTYSYDNLGELTDATNGANASTSYGYDLAGNLTSLTYPGSTGTVSRSYDDAGQLTSVTDWASRSFAYSYDADGNPITLTYPNGVTATNNYDNADRLTSLTDTNGSTTLASFSNTLDAAGLTTTVTTSGTPQPNQSYGYNALNQLTSAAANNLTYDNAGNVTTLDDGTTETYDDASQLLTSTPTTGPASSYAYDQRGNRITATPSGGSTTTYSYNEANNLTGVGSNISYSYDGDGQRTSKTVNSTANAFTYDQAAALPLILTDGTNTYVYGLGDTPLEQINGSTPTYLHTDPLGSVRLLTDDTATATATFSYTPYGKPDGHTGTATTAFGFAGEYTDTETGFQYLRARYYDPATATFLTRDPLEDTTGTPYAYAAGDPINNVDPAGLNTISDWATSYDESGWNPVYNALVDGDKTYHDAQKGCWGQALHDGISTLNDAADAATIGLGGAGLAREGLARIAEREAADAAAGAAAKAPTVISAGELKLPGVPKGATGIPVQTGKGLEYAIPRGTPEIDPRVTSVRIMDPVTSGKYQYPNGYAVYLNKAGQTVNPLTGQTISNADPYAHIPLP